MYPGLTNTRVELRKIVRSSCFMILRIHLITTWKIQEIAFQGFQISKFSRGSMSPDPLAPQLQCPGAATELEPTITIMKYSFVINIKRPMYKSSMSLNFQNFNSSLTVLGGEKCYPLW